MNLLIVEYCATQHIIERHLQQHRAYLACNLREGNYLLAGKLLNGQGGLILTRNATPQEVNEWIAADPYTRAGVAKFQIMPWKPSMRASHRFLNDAFNEVMHPLA